MQVWAQGDWIDVPGIAKQGQLEAVGVTKDTDPQKIIRDLPVRHACVMPPHLGLPVRDAAVSVLMIFPYQWIYSVPCHVVLVSVLGCIGTRRLCRAF